MLAPVSEIFHVYHASKEAVPGAVQWHGDDYLSFCQALDGVTQRIKSVSLSRPVSLAVHAQAPGFTAEQLEKWKVFYCTEKELEVKAEYALMWQQGFKFLWKCLFLLWACLSIAYVFDQLKLLGAYAQMLGRETFFFLGWVILWKPIEMIVFEPWALKHQLKLIQKLHKTPLTLATV